MGKYCLFSIFQMVGQVLLIVGSVFLGHGLYGVVLSFLLIRLITFLILFIYILKKIGIIIPTFSPIKKYLSFSLPLLGGGLSYWVVASSDRYLINLFWGVIVIPSVFGLSVLSRQLLIIFSTKEIADNGYFITPFITLSILFYGVSCFFCQILVLAKKTKINATIWTVSALLNFGLNLIFIPIFGILAAAITTLLSYLFSFGLIWYFAFKEFKFEIDWQFIIKSIIASVLMSLFIIQFDPIGLLNVLIAMVLAVLVYGVLIFLFKGISKKEIYFFKDLILNFKKTVI